MTRPRQVVISEDLQLKDWAVEYFSVGTALAVAAILALHLAWVALRWVVYQISYTVGRGFQAGRKG